MAQNAYAATFGTTISYGDVGGTPTYVPLAGVKEIGGLPALEADEFEITRIDQTSPLKQFAASMIDPGELEFTLGFDKAKVTTLYGLHRLAKAWKVLFSDGSALSFEGWVKTITPEASTDDEVTVAVTVRVSGAVVFAAAA